MVCVSSSSPCIFCQIARSCNSNNLIHKDETVVAFQDIHPSAFSLSSLILTLHLLQGSTWVYSVILKTEIKPIGFLLPASMGRHYLVIPMEHIPTVKNLQRRAEDFYLVSHMLKVGQDLVHRDAPQSKHYRFGFHQPPFNSVNHLHLHCFALPYIPGWKQLKYLSLGKLGGFIEAEKLLQRLNPSSAFSSKI